LSITRSLSSVKIIESECTEAANGGVCKLSGSLN